MNMTRGKMVERGRQTLENCENCPCKLFKNNDKMCEVVKDAAQRQADIFNNTTSSLGKGLSKSIKKKTSVASNFVREFSEFCDTDDLIKSFRKLSNPQYHSNGYVIHTPKDWSKYRPAQSSEEEDYSDVSKDHVRSASDYYAQMRTSFARTHYKHNPQPSEELEQQTQDKIQI